MLRTLLLVAGLGGAGYVVYTMAKNGTLQGLLQWPLSLTNGGTATTGGDTAVQTALNPDVPSGAPRGIVNNNPGNIVYSASNNWQGQTGTDGTFAVFDTPQDGLRAMMDLLNSYIVSGLNTIAKISTKWTTTQQTAWANNVSQYAGIGLNDILPNSDETTLGKLANGVTVAENGTAWNGYYNSVIPTALAML